MTADEARALFDQALDGDLVDERQQAFEAALQADPSLRAEFDQHRSVLSAASELGRVSTVDLLSGVQHKLRARSGGKFYRDRFSERRGPSGSLSMILGASAVLVLCVLVWFAYEGGFFGR